MTATETRALEACPICHAMSDDIYLHYIWHGLEPRGRRFKKRYEADLAHSHESGRAIGWA